MIAQNIDGSVAIARRDRAKESEIAGQYVGSSDQLLLFLLEQTFEYTLTHVEFFTQIQSGILFDCIADCEESSHLDENQQADEKYNDALFETPELK